MKATYICPKCEVEVFDIKEYMQAISQDPTKSGISEVYGSSDDFYAKDNFGGEWETF